MKKAKSMMTAYISEVKAFLPDSLSEEQKDTLVNEAISKIDVSKYYKQAVIQTKRVLSDEYISLLNMAEVLSRLNVTSSTFGEGAKQLVFYFGIGFLIVGVISFVVSVKIMNPKEEY
ncbi:hypothetical protein M2475_001791 [Breznakia sp. PF5-3]|uniref:hypothetical protein n=1 Tax=unclassified Breznakia TaxID=2623764 RepID=UPI002404EF0A|nr:MULTISPECIES: hypothetical protein [unclassified Breznakia]MDF9825302.1 hypothetical protein [Breznakia sp. PM6-1]MDF9836215.1 hypothetical protein [Breznakia sp. PF5-3]MDF9838444.1 hypothetical protein [Breznakia sp. PFB2-8]MDF9860460.1 hypothetical protein [Breznakia sp. PH5-24]